MKTSPSGQKSFEAVKRVLRVSGTSVSQEVCQRLTRYFEELAVWNQRMDLTGFKDLESMVIHHLGDTLTVLPSIGGGDIRLLDVGSGAGVPGLLLKVLSPPLSATLVDSRRRRVSFLRYVIGVLGLRGIEAIHATLKPLVPVAPLVKASYDVVISRAVSDLLTMARIARPYLAPQGRLILMKGPKGLMELDEFANILGKEGWRFEYVEKTVPLSGARRIIIIGVVESH